MAAGAGRFTDDALFGGRLALRQPRRGYRFATDSVLLAAAALPHAAGADVLDAGCGCGVVGLALLHLAGRDRAPRSVLGLEIQAELAGHAARNARTNGLPLRALRGDLREPPLAISSFDLVVANPPYRRAGTGRLAPEPGRAQGRHELTLTWPELLAASTELLRPGGRLFVVHLAEREAELLEAVAAAGLSSRSLLRVRARPDADAATLVLGLSRGAAEAPVRPRDLVLHGEGGEPRPAWAALLAAAPGVGEAEPLSPLLAAAEPEEPG